LALDTRALVREATDLAPLPQAATRLVAILSREDWKDAEVLEVVRLDPVLTGKVLGAANSAASRAQKKILDVQEAVRRIGPRAVVGIALATGVKQRMSLALPQFGLGEGELWRHSVAALLAAELASPHFRLSYSTAGVTAALLHDVGKIVMARFLDPDTLEYLRLARVEGGESERGAEMEILAVSHGELGALVAAHWGMPEVQYHHDLAGVPEAHRRDAALVKVADSAAKVVAPSRLPAHDDPEELAAAQAILRIEPADFPAFCEAVERRFRKIGAAY
jgi:HD-like signal output (HDOD) protein